MSKLLAMMMKPKEYMYATIKGKLTENNGVFSEFSDSNYLELQQPFILNANTVAEIVFKINLSMTDTYTSNIILGYPNSYNIQVNCVGNPAKLHLFIGNGNSWNILNNKIGITTILTNTNYFLKLIFNKNTVELLLSTDNINWTTEISQNITISQEYTYDLAIGKGRTTEQYLFGSIDLNQSYIKINNTKYQLQAVVGYKVVGNPTIVDGVVSGFSSANYLTLPSIPENSYSKIEIHTKIKLSNVTMGNIITTNDFRYQGIYVRSNLKIGSSMQLGTLGYPITYNVDLIVNQDYIIDFIIDTENLFTKLIVNNSDKSATITVTNKREILYLLGYGINGALNGEIYLKDTWIKKDNKLWFNGEPAN